MDADKNIRWCLNLAWEMDTMVWIARNWLFSEIVSEIAGGILVVRWESKVIENASTRVYIKEVFWLNGKNILVQIHLFLSYIN